MLSDGVGVKFQQQKENRGLELHWYGKDCDLPPIQAAMLNTKNEALHQNQKEVNASETLGRLLLSKYRSRIGNKRI